MTPQQDGAPCTADNQCLGGACRTEAGTGNPGGRCSNSAPCNSSAQTGCHGGYCDPNTSLCFAPCTGTGLGSSGNCRAGYVCYDPDTTPGNNNNFCVPLCDSDSECTGTGAGYGCNPYSNLCGQKNNGLSGYGATCTSNNQCETGYCYGEPNGYCLGPCRGDTKVCASGGVCYFDPSLGDNIGSCWKGCTDPSQCRADESCYYLDANTTACTCGFSNYACDFDSDCCSGTCYFGGCL